jgi:TonB family protein
MKRLLKSLACVALLSAAMFSADRPERKLISREMPEYPTVAARMNLHGTVRLKIWVTSDGKVRRIEYIGGHPLLAESAMKSVKNWRYQPEALESTAEVALKF